MMLFFILLFFQHHLAHVAMVTTVPGCYRDRDKDHRPRENCTAAGFTSIPTGIEPSIKVLLFPRNLFSSLSWSSFQKFDKIYQIDLSFNKVPRVVPSIGPVLPTLSVLNLGSNLLTSLPDQSFSACPALTELYLNNNSIQSLSNQTFAGLSKLEILDLSSNLIRVLPTLMLHPLPAIETLYLEFNKIAVMPDDWFSTKVEVPYLFLSANPWTCSCSLGYFYQYLVDNELNVYVRDGPILTADAESVVCDSPPRLKHQALLTLKESNLCSTDSDPSEQEVTFLPPLTTTRTLPPPPPPPPVVSTSASPTPAPAFYIRHGDTPLNYHRVVTRSWLDYITRVVELTQRPRADSTKGPDHMPTTAAPKLATTTRPSTTSELWVVTTPSLIESTPVMVPSTTPLTTTKHLAIATTSTVKATIFQVTTRGAVKGSKAQEHDSTKKVQVAEVLCLWLFIACVLLCVVSAAGIAATAVRLAVWHQRVYKPLKVALANRHRVGEKMRLLMHNGREEREMTGGVGGAVMALYRSVLFIHREGDQRLEEEDEVRRSDGGGGEEKARVLVSLEPRGGGGLRREEKEGSEERGVYRKTMYRLVSKDKVVAGWRDVTEESWVPADETMRERTQVSKKRYSVILREEMGEEAQRQQEREWVVGGWEVKGGEVAGERNVEEEQRSSWGQWLVQFLPSVPWGVTTPSGGEGSSVISVDQFS